MDNAIGAWMPRVSAVLFSAGVFAMFPLPGHAQLAITGGQVERVTDNANKTATNENSDLESRTYVTASYVTDPGQCNAIFSGTLSYSIWQNNSFDNETSGNMNLNSECELATGLFWDLDNNLREVSKDTTQSDTPNNRTRKNIFSTGPRYIWRLGSRDSIALNTRYETTKFEDPDETDSERYASSAAWSHLFSQTLTGGISASYTTTELDSGAKINVQTVRATGSKNWATTSLSGAFGVSEIETDFGSTSQTSDGFVGELNLTRALNPSTNWYLSAARELTDQTSSFDIRFEEFEFNLTESISVQTTTVSTGVNKRFSDQSSLTADVFANQSDYLGTDELNESVGLNIRYSRSFSESVSGNTMLGYRRSTFEPGDSDSQTLRLEIGLDYQASRKLSLFGKLGHEQRTSSVSSREYDELWGLLGVEYKFR